MKNLSKMMVATIVACMGVFACNAKSIFWGGAATGIWAVGNAGAETGGWQLAAGTPAIFEDGDSVTFGDAPNDVTITATGSFTVGDFVVNATNQYTIKATSRTVVNDVLTVDGIVTEAQSVIKRGSGKLRFELFSGNWTCPMLIEEGPFEGAYQVNYMVGVRDWANPTNSFFGDLSVERDIIVGTPDTAASVTITGDLNNYNPASNPLYQMNLFTLTTPNVVPKARFIFDNGLFQKGSQRTVFGPIVLRNGGSIEKAKYDGQQRYFNGTIKVERRADNEPSLMATIVEPDTDGGSFFGIGTGEPVVFDVDEVTATANADGTVSDDGQSDLQMALRIYDSTDTRWPGKTAWTKRGPGQMELCSVAGKCVSYSSDYRGDIVIEEGTLATRSGVQRDANLSLLGRMDDPTRKIVFCPNTTFKMCGSTFAHVSWVSPEVTLVASNATIYSESSNVLPCMELYGSTKFHTTGVASEQGIITFGRRTYFNLDYPFVVTNLLQANGNTRPDNSNFVCLSCDANQYIVVASNFVDGVLSCETNTYGFAEFCIEEAKNKTMGIADVILNTAVRNQNPNTSYTKKMHSGILKTGPGVLSMVRPDITRYSGNTGPSIIREGGFLLDGEIKSDVIVEDGAFIGGKGKTLAGLEIQEGGGFLVDATNLTVSLTVNGDFNLPKTGNLTIYNYTNQLSEAKVYLTHIPLPKVVGNLTIAGEDATKNGDNTIPLINYDTSNWRVVLKGFDQKDCKRHLRVVKNSDDTLSVDYIVGQGFSVIVR